MPTPAFTACRTLGHAWESVPTPLDAARPRSGVWMFLRCTRCAMVRRDEVDPRSGMVWRRSYDPPPGYARTRDEWRPRDDWRLDYLRATGIIKRAKRGNHLRRVS